MPGCHSLHFDERQSVGLQNSPGETFKIKGQKVRKFVEIGKNCYKYFIFYFYFFYEVDNVKYRKSGEEATAKLLHRFSFCHCLHHQTPNLSLRINIAIDTIHRLICKILSRFVYETTYSAKRSQSMMGFFISCVHQSLQ